MTSDCTTPVLPLLCPQVYGRYASVRVTSFGKHGVSLTPSEVLKKHVKCSAVATTEYPFALLQQYQFLPGFFFLLAPVVASSVIAH